MKPWYSANSFIRRDFYKCHFSFPILFHKWAQTLFMILAVMDARINHVHPCVFFATFQTAQRPGLLKYNSWGTGDKRECESSTSSNQVHLKNLNASGFHSYLLDKESISAWWSESQTKVREDFFFFNLLDLPQHRNAASSCPLIAFPSGRGAESCCQGGPEEMPGIPGHCCKGGPVVPRLTHFWTISGCRLKPSFLPNILSICSTQQTQKFAWRRKRGSRRRWKRKLCLLFRKQRAVFQCLRGDVDLWVRGALPPVLRDAGCRFRFLCYYSWRALSSWWSKRMAILKREREVWGGVARVRKGSVSLHGSRQKC